MYTQLLSEITNQQIGSNFTTYYSSHNFITYLSLFLRFSQYDRHKSAMCTSASTAGGLGTAVR